MKMDPPPPYTGGYPVFPETVQGPNYPTYMPDNNPAPLTAASSPVINANAGGQTQTDTRQHDSSRRRRSRSRAQASMSSCNFNRSHRVNPNMSLQSGGIFTTSTEHTPYMTTIHVEPEFYSYQYDAFSENGNVQHSNIRIRRTDETVTHPQSGALDLTLSADQQSLNDEIASRAYYHALFQANHQLRTQNRSNEELNMPQTVASLSAVQDSGRYSTVSECIPDMNDSNRNEANSYRRNDHRNNNHTLTNAEAPQFYQMPTSFPGQVPEIPSISPQRNVNSYYPNDIRHRQPFFVPPNMIAPSHPHMAACSRLKYQYNPFGLNAATVLMDPNMMNQSNSNPGNLRNPESNHVNPCSSGTDQYMDCTPSTSNDQPPCIPKKKKSETEGDTLGKRTRHVFSHAQLDVLEKKFTDSKYCKVNERQTLANILGVTEKQVKVWFQNRRSRDNRKNLNANNRHIENGDGLLETETRRVQRGRKRKVVEQSTSDIVESQYPHSRFNNSADSMIGTRNKRARSDSETSSPEVVQVIGRPKHTRNTPMRKYVPGNHFIPPNNENDVLNININNLNELNNLLPRLQALNVQNLVPNPENQQQRNLSHFIMINNQFNNQLQQVFVPNYSLTISRQPGSMPNQYDLCNTSIAPSHGNAAQDVSNVYSRPISQFLNNHNISQIQGASIQNRHNIHQQQPTNSLNTISSENSICTIPLDRQHQLPNNGHDRFPNSNSDKHSQNIVKEESSTLQSMQSHNASNINNQYNQLEILSKFAETYCSSSESYSSDKNPGKTNSLDQNANKIQSDNRKRVHASTINSTKSKLSPVHTRNSDKVSVAGNNILDNSAIATETASKPSCKNFKDISPDPEAVTIIHEVSCQASTNKYENPPEIILISDTTNITDIIEDSYKPKQQSQKPTEIDSSSMRENDIILNTDGNKINMDTSPAIEYKVYENNESDPRTLTTLRNTPSTTDINAKSCKSILGKSSKSSTLHPLPRNSFRFNDSDNDIEDSVQSTEWNSISNSNIDNPFTSPADVFITTASATATLDSTVSSSEMLFKSVQNSTSTTANETSQCTTLIDSMLSNNGIQRAYPESQTFSDCYKISTEILNGTSTNDSNALITMPEAQRMKNIPTVPIKVEDVTGENEISLGENRYINGEVKNSDFGSKNLVTQNPFQAVEISNQNNGIFNLGSALPSETDNSACSSYLFLSKIQENAENPQNATNFKSEDSDEGHCQNQLIDIQELSDMSRSKAKKQYPALENFLSDVEIKKEPLEYTENDITSMQNILSQSYLTQFNYSTMELFNSFSEMHDSTTENSSEPNKHVNGFQEQTREILLTNANTNSSQIPSNSSNTSNPFRASFSSKNTRLQSNTKSDLDGTSSEGHPKVTELFNDFITPNTSEVSIAVQSNSLQEINCAAALNPFRCNTSNDHKTDSNETTLPKMNSQNSIQAQKTFSKVKSETQLHETNNSSSENTSHPQYYTGPSLPRQGYSHMVANKGNLCELKSTSTSSAPNS